MRAGSCLLIMWLFGATLLAGCGRHDGGASGRTSALLHLYQVGDSWTYEFKGTKRWQTGVSAPFTSTITESVVRDASFGQNSLAFRSSWSVAVEGGSGVVGTDTSYFTQDPVTRDVCVYATAKDADPVKRVTDNPVPVSMLGSRGLGTSVVSTTHYSDGSQRTDSLTVVAEEEVEMPAGVFRTWKQSESSSKGDGSSTDATVWFAAELGNTVKSAATTSYADGAIAALTGVLTSSTVAVR